MFVFPKGCKVYAFSPQGECLGECKRKRRSFLSTTLWNDAAPYRRLDYGSFLVVQPRGKQKWWGYVYRQPDHTDDYNHWRFAINSKSREAVVMAILLRG